MLSKDDRIEVSDLPPALRKAYSFAPAGSHGTLLENERILLKEILEECNWNKKQAARRLGISRNTLYVKLKKYEISSPTTH